MSARFGSLMMLQLLPPAKIFDDGGISFLLLGSYYSNASKIFLVVKDEYKDEAKTAFGDTSVTITTHGKRHLGAAVESRDFTTEYVTC